MNSRTQPTPQRVWLPLFLASLTAILVGLTSSAAAAAGAAGAETRVRASAVSVGVLVEPPQRVAAGQQLGKDVAGHQIVVATGVAEKAGVKAEIEGEIEVFAHGTTGTVAKEMVETQGGNLGAAGGAHGGKLFAVPDVAVAEVFAARTAGRVAGAEPAVVGIALPKSVVTQLKQQKLLVSRPVPNPPQGVSSGAQEWVFQPGALEILKAHGFFFAVH